MKLTSVLLFCFIGSALIGFAQESKVPAISADNTLVEHPPRPTEPGMKGYGTRGVEGKTVTEMLASCQAHLPLTRLQAARCDQLKRSLKAQPDGTIQKTLESRK